MEAWNSIARRAVKLDIGVASDLSRASFNLTTEDGAKHEFLISPAAIQALYAQLGDILFKYPGLAAGQGS